MEASRSKLQSLQYPYAADVNFCSRGDVVILVSWLEDRKIRELEIEERETLRKDSETWDKTFNSYLSRLGCPFEWVGMTTATSTNMEVVDCISWLVAHSVSTEYEDAAEACANMESSAGGETGTVFDFTVADMEVEEREENEEEDGPAAALRAAVDKLGNSVMLARESGMSDDTFLRAIGQKVKLYLTDGSINALKTLGQNCIPLEQFPLGFSLSGGQNNDTLSGPNDDPQMMLVRDIAVVMRMLHLLDFRELQVSLSLFIRLASCVMWSGASDSSGDLLSYSLISLA